MEIFLELLFGGLNALKEYIALHVLTCLIPAFLLAGGIVTFVSREAIIGYLGAAARKLSSFGIAAGGSFFVAACSCTVIPVASGIYYGGAGIGAAFILLWVAPAANILALVYTGSILGTQMVIARLVSALLMSFVVGLVMAYAFRKEEKNRVSTIQMSRGPLMSRHGVILLLLLVAWLLAPNYIVTQGPYWQKVVVWAVGLIIVGVYAVKAIDKAKIKDWLRESWWFMRIIFPLLLVGVFIVGIIGAVLPQAWIETWLGGAGLRQSFLATLIGAVTYFATMTEAPFVDTLMNLGMGKGPALALLLTGPGISLPNWLAIARVFGTKKALVYIPTIVVLGTLVGWVAGFILD
ncbi:MAG TPA: permease [Dehalococcoidales bacterium]|nr:permease [Dehalococcoidales bacterium]